MLAATEPPIASQPAQQPAQAPPETSPLSGQGPLNQNASNGLIAQSLEAKTGQNGKTKHLWTSESAREAGRKGAAALAEKRRNPPPVITQPEPANPRLELVREQIDRTRKVLNSDEMEPHHRAALLRALDGLLDRERIILGIPGPGTLKPQSPRRSKPSISDLQPQPITPQEPAGPTG